MKKVFAVVLAVVIFASLGGVAMAGTGNGTPNMGTAYTLNIIGVKEGHEKNIDNCGNGHRIFVQLGSKDVTKTTDIWLEEGDFAVMDCDGTDGDAGFRLPKPVITDNPEDPDGGCISYSVYIKALGQPGGSAKITTCAIDEDGNRVCSTESHVATSSTGKGAKTYVNVTKELLTLCVCEWDEGNEKWVCHRVGLFDDEFEDYLWQYDNNGLKHAQLKFYMDPTCYDAKGWKCPEPPPPES